MLIALRIALYAQVLLGLGRFFGMVTNPRVWEGHMSLGALIVVLALLGLRPHPKVGDDPIRNVARFAPVIVLLTGAFILSGVVPGRGFVVLHMILGLLTVGLVERSAARQRRALTSAA